MRKIIQITGQGQLGEYFALCDDGTVWRRTWGDPIAPKVNHGWEREPAIPQPELGSDGRPIPDFKRAQEIQRA